jgi:Aminoglycoside-2''-adenylyltransferase
MNESLITSEQLAALAELDQVLSAHGFEYWLFGGWAVDFHVGRVTRTHGDIDLAIWRDNLEDVVALLRDGGWIHRPDVDEDGYTAYERLGIRLEIANLVRDEHGVVYTPLQDGRADWPADSFRDEIAHLAGVRARVLSCAALLAEKSVIRADEVAAAKDRADVANLSRAARVRVATE